MQIPASWDKVLSADILPMVREQDTRSCQLPCGRMPGAQLLALAFGVPEFEGLQGQSISLREGSAVLFTGLGRPREPRNGV